MYPKDLLTLISFLKKLCINNEGLGPNSLLENNGLGRITNHKPLESMYNSFDFAFLDNMLIVKNTWLCITILLLVYLFEKNEKNQLT